MKDFIKFTDSEREYLKEMRALDIDTNGHEILVGLTLEETDFYMTYSRGDTDEIYSSEDSDKFLELYEKHEKVRLSILAGEIELKNENPTQH